MSSGLGWSYGSHRYFGRLLWYGQSGKHLFDVCLILLLRLLFKGYKRYRVKLGDLFQWLIKFQANHELLISHLLSLS